jgi:ParB family chromosome partitioning protein
MAAFQMKWMKPQDIIVREQVRKDSDPKAQKELNASVKANNILQPLLVMLSGILLAGHRRLIAALAAGLETVPVIITDRLLSDTEIRLIQLTENIQRAALSAYEKWLACAELMCMNPDWQMKDLAEHLHIDPSMVTRLLSPSKCIEAVQEALRKGEIGIGDTYELSHATPEQQPELLKLKLAGASRQAIKDARSKARNNKAASVTVRSIRCPLPSGTTVVVKGNAVSIDDAIQALTDLLKAMKKAAEEGIDGKTFGRMCADKAKAR